jgi:hypothetical protein
MKNKTYMLNTLLAAIFGLYLLAAIVVRTFAPQIILPKANIPNLVLVSLAALLLDHYMAPGAKRCYICIPVFSALAFGLLPWAASFVSGAEAVKLAIVGGVVFTITTWLFSSIQERLSTGPAAKAAPFMSALGLWLAAQALVGIIL